MSIVEHYEILFPALLPTKGAIQEHPHARERPVALNGQHPWLRSLWTIIPTRLGYCLIKTNCVNHSHCEDNHVYLMRMQRRAYRMG